MPKPKPRTHRGEIPPKSGPKSLHPADRRCEHDDCDVKLGRYNPGPNCYVHAPRIIPRRHTH